MQQLFGIRIIKLRLDRWRRCRGQLPGGPAGDGENTSSFGDMLDELEWPSLETHRRQSFLNFFYKIHSGTVSLDKDKYLTLAPNVRRTRASHESQYTRYLAYSDALKNYVVSPGLSQCGIVSPFQWSHPRPLRSLRLEFRLLVQRYIYVF